MLVGQQLGPFTIDTEIGCGAMGRVYRACYAKTGQSVALKIIGGGYDTNPTALARFEREAAILKKLSHPNIVRLFATGRYRETPFYVMEFVEGQTLEAMLQRRGRFTWEEVVNLGQQVCAALQHAHEQGIIHRDLKPANIMMTAEGTVKLTDFGIAKGLEVTQLTATNSTVGTASYMSPEQCRGERNLTHKSDLYSLGVVFYELLTGRRPFVEDTTLKMFLAHTEGKFERPSRLILDIPIWLDTLVCQLMEKDPEKRPFDAAMVARSLNETLEKVAAQRSAGVDVATARRVDMPRGRPKADEIDKEAARLLRAAATKKKIKRKSRPFYERTWFLVAAGASLLLGMSTMVWLVVKPATPEQLFRQAKVSMDSSNPDDWGKAREGPIASFLKHYADQTDEQAVQMRRWADQVDVYVRERQMYNRIKLTPEEGAETTARAALRQEEEGDLDAAAERWQQLAKYLDSNDTDQRPWGLLADKRLRDLQQAKTLERQIKEEIRHARSGDGEFNPGSEAERRAGMANHAEVFGDLALALDYWQKLKVAYQNDHDRLSWFLLAAKKTRELRDKVSPGVSKEKARRDLVEDKLAEAEHMRSKPEQARIIYRDIVLLYEKSTDDELVNLVNRARQLLKDLEKPSR
jgi:serine/threonine-protein kinase